jgi:hypothetical protein
MNNNITLDRLPSNWQQIENKYILYKVKPPCRVCGKPIERYNTLYLCDRHKEKSKMSSILNSILQG